MYPTYRELPACGPGARAAPPGRHVALWKALPFTEPLAVPPPHPAQLLLKNTPDPKWLAGLLLLPASPALPMTTLGAPAQDSLCSGWLLFTPPCQLRSLPVRTHLSSLPPVKQLACETQEAATPLLACSSSKWTQWQHPGSPVPAQMQMGAPRAGAQ